MPTSQGFVDFRAVKASVSMEQILTHYRLIESFKRSDDSLSGPCPIHHGSNPTQFRVSLSKNAWNCFGDCHGGGNVLDFVCQMEDVEVREAAHKLIEWFNLPTGQGRSNRSKPKPDRRSQPPADSSELEFNKPLGFALKELDVDHPYLADRGLTPAVVAEFGLGCCNAGTMKERIVIPIHNKLGQLTGYIGRWPGDPPTDVPKYQLPKGFKKSAELFNLHRALKQPPGQPLIIVEGAFDVFHLWQHGFRKTIALLGSSLSATQERLLIGHLAADERVALMLDEDEAGRKGREEILPRLAQHWFTRVITFPDEGTQPEHLDDEQLQNMLGGAP